MLCVYELRRPSGHSIIMIYFMTNHLKDKSGVLIDARMPKWFKKGTIPGSVNIPYTHLKASTGADEFLIEDALALLGAEKEGEQWDFFDAKELVLWCNGPWCGQSSEAIRDLLELGYPAEKIRYFRGGMQAWQMLGFNIIKT
jgi:rhodanese-related sulfurtransferase